MTKDVQRKRIATADPKIEEEIRQRAYELFEARRGTRRLRTGRLA